MPAETKAVRCAAGVWTLLTAGRQNVLLQIRSVGTSAVFVGASAPVLPPDPAGTGAAANFITLSNGRPFSLALADSASSVWLQPFGADLTIEVVSE